MCIAIAAPRPCAASPPELAGAGDAKSNLTFDINGTWWPNDESGSGIQFFQIADFALATLYVCSPSGHPTFSVTALTNLSPGRCVRGGPLSKTTGPWFGGPFNPSAVVETEVGVLTFIPSGIGTGPLEYNRGPTVVTKTIHRQPLRLENNTGDYFVVATRTLSCDGGARTASMHPYEIVNGDESITGRCDVPFDNGCMPRGRLSGLSKARRRATHAPRSGTAGKCAGVRAGARRRCDLDARAASRTLYFGPRTVHFGSALQPTLEFRARRPGDGACDNARASVRGPSRFRAGRPVAPCRRPLDSPSLATALFLGLVEGLTEFLPISSTGHLIVAGSLLDYTGERAKVFELAIQSGAMLAVVWEYRARFGRAIAGLGSDPAARRFALNLAIAFVPAGALGFLFGSKIQQTLFSPVPVALAFVAGAFVILWAERRQRRDPRAIRVAEVDDMTALDALKVGVAQAFALIPGTSRSGATIIGGMLFGLSRKAATEFSFFLAVPTLVAAGAYSTWKSRALLSNADVVSFAPGFAAAFVSALVCIRWLIRYVSRHDFTPFAWYRIAFGAIVLVTAWTGWVAWK